MRYYTASLYHTMLAGTNPDEPDGEFKGYTNIFTELIPRLQKRGYRKGY